MQQWSEAYKVPGVDENEPAMNPAQKRKQAQLDDVRSTPHHIEHEVSDTNSLQPAENPNAAKANRTAKPATVKATATDRLLDPNNAIFVTGLPLDVNTDEIEKVFQRYGVIAEMPHNSDKIIHITEDDDGLPTGSAVIGEYFTRPSSLLS
jgi:HIV Tat-specific factor 1